MDYPGLYDDFQSLSFCSNFSKIFLLSLAHLLAPSRSINSDKICVDLHSKFQTLLKAWHTSSIIWLTKTWLRQKFSNSAMWNACLRTSSFYNLTNNSSRNLCERIRIPFHTAGNKTEIVQLKTVTLFIIVFLHNNGPQPTTIHLCSKVSQSPANSTWAAAFLRAEFWTGNSIVVKS